MNDNQNVYVRNGRSTSRVLNRPGGTCQITLGGYTEEELERMRKLREEREAKNNPNTSTLNENLGVENEKKIVKNEQPEKAKDTSPVVQKATEQQPAPCASLPPFPGANAPLSSNAFASSSTTNSFNVLTNRPTSRVSNQPGGRSNFTLG